jgi:flavorubredoxin
MERNEEGLLAAPNRNDVIAEVFRTKAVLIGPPTWNQELLPTIAAILEDFKGLKFKNKIGAAFGSFGWSGESVKRIEANLSAPDIPLAAEGVLAKRQPNPQDLEECERLGMVVSRAIKGKEPVG